MPNFAFRLPFLTIKRKCAYALGLRRRGAYEACHELCERVLESDPYALQALPLSLSSALVLGRRSELFMRGHNLVAEYPSHAVAWYAVSCYCTVQGLGCVCA